MLIERAKSGSPNITTREQPDGRYVVVWLEGERIIATLAGPFKSAKEAGVAATAEREKVERKGWGVRR
jgi:hypothetical protein